MLLSSFSLRKDCLFITWNTHKISPSGNRIKKLINPKRVKVKKKLNQSIKRLGPTSLKIINLNFCKVKKLKIDLNKALQLELDSKADHF